MALPHKSFPYIWQTPWHLVLIFSLLSAGILGLGYFYYAHQVALLERAKEAELNTIADLKVHQIMAWRQERLNDALLIFNDSHLAAKVQDWFKGQGPPGQEDIISQHLASLKQGSFVAATLFDPHGQVRLSTPEVKSEPLFLIKTIALEAIRTKRIIFHDLYPVPQSNEINMSLAIPIIINHKNVVAAVVYQIDPNYYLYPILQSLPTPSKTAELVMVRREIQSNEILFLNRLHHVQGAPLWLRKSLTETQLPSVKAVLGEEGIVRGIDYRGVPVLAANRLIPDSPWFLTAKIDLSEVQAPLRRWSYLILLMTITLMGAAGLGVALLWRNRDVSFYRQQFKSESERLALSQRYEYLTKYANDIILVMDQDWKIVEANDRAVDSYGYAKDELFSLNLWDLIADRHRSETEIKMELELETKAGLSLEATNRRQNGTTFPAEISASLMEVGGARLYQCIIRDVSDRKLREQTLKESEQQLRFLSSQLLIVQEKERGRISKELHDELGQNLMILKYQINSLETRLPKNKKVLRSDCEDLLHYLDIIIENVRRLSWDLRPLALEKFGLATTIKNLLKDFGKHYDIQWEPLQIEAINNLFSPLSQINIYRLFQESLTNIAKHAQATQISVRIDKQDACVTFAIEDNGKGFDPQAEMNRESGQRGIGLATMHERSRMAGGRLEIRSQTGTGTRLIFTIPSEIGA
jgi:PAS domain S-box-containing protein